MRGTAGFNVLADRGVLRFSLARTMRRPGSGDAQVTVSVKGRPVDAFELPERGTRECRYAWPDRDLVFVEVTAARRGTGDAVSLAVTPLKTD